MYLFYQRIHKKRLLNGARHDTIADWINDSLFDLTKSGVPEGLSALGVRYVIIHKEATGIETVRKVETMNGLEKVNDFPDVAVLKVAAKPSKVIFTTAHFYREEDWKEKEKGRWRWMADNGKFVFYIKEEEEKVSLSFKLISFHQERELKIDFNGTLLENLKVFPANESQIFLKDLVINKGVNIITLSTNPSKEKIDDYLHNSDRREVSIALGDILLISDSGEKFRPL